MAIMFRDGLISQLMIWEGYSKISQLEKLGDDGWVVGWVGGGGWLAGWLGFVNDKDWKGQSTEFLVHSE